MKTLRPLIIGFLFCLTIHAPALRAQDRVQEEFNQTYDLAPGSVVSVKNTNGSVTINGWDQARVQVTAIKKGRSKSDIDEVHIQISPEPNRLSIQTIHPRKNNNNTSVSYTLMVPRNAHLDPIESTNGSLKIADVSGQINANTTNGSITVLNANGAANANTVNGSITVELGQVDAGKSMRFSTTNGSIKVQLPDNINAQVKARTTNGGIHTDFPLTVQGKYNSKCRRHAGQRRPDVQL